MTKSALDAIPGIGEKKRMALLTAFGSVKDIADVDEAELAKVAGKTVARKVKQILDPTAPQ